MTSAIIKYQGLRFIYINIRAAYFRVKRGIVIGFVHNAGAQTPSLHPAWVWVFRAFGNTTFGKILVPYLWWEVRDNLREALRCFSIKIEVWWFTG